ncbi:dihydrolipoamide dehydrogenase [Microbacterium endophyticum]|uniref:Dihydrolipoyl dehydrogenase n=1 Tax=Microbacterium endophyticum TaxID=1526412 RepID=A0A7W4V591_9MICO|nr:dihydrolipoyl dehydrogenase [Microbacterium endophyticum]MBB2976964.1 dihydrolipoamide dehydrogenase [Microbacterium endophyticum]NIK36750.1 dihydrolipoamide dehydrogenase [Microbacterium endophyticum]
MAIHSADIVVLGGGSGGYATALRARELGKSVILIEKDKVGGTCLHRGCIPTKAMLHAGEVADATREASQLGVNAHFDGVDVGALHGYRDKIVSKKFQGLQGLLSTRGVTVVSGEGVVSSDRTVSVGSETYQGDALVIATGSASRTLPGIEIGGRVLTSEEALALPEIPARVAVLGGGVIGVEFASMWRSLGADVSIIEAADHLVPAEDVDVSKGLERAFRKRGIAFSLGTPFATVAQTSDAVEVTLANGDIHAADYLLVAVGRAPVTSTLGLDEAGIATERGFIVTDERLATTQPGVWAVGDVVAGLQLAHRSFQHGIFVAEEIAGLGPTVIPETHIPKVTYSHPEVASVGLSAAAAEAAYGASEVSSYTYNLAGNARSEILGTAGIVKVVRRADGPVLGVHLLGDRVGELISEAQLVVGWDAHPEDIAPYVHAHPTQSEALGEAFLALAGKPLHGL